MTQDLAGQLGASLGTTDPAQREREYLAAVARAQQSHTVKEMPGPGVVRFEAMEMHGDPGAIFASLSAAQAEFGPVERTRENPFYGSKYADLADVLRACMPALNKHGLSLSQLPTRPAADGGWIVYTILGHKSGAFWLLRASIPAAEWQKFGSALTYCRRYQDSAILGVASEADDDGNEADSRGPRANSQPTPPKAKPVTKPADAAPALPRPASVPPPTPSAPPKAAGALSDEENAVIRELFKSRTWEGLPFANKARAGEFIQKTLGKGSAEMVSADFATLKTALEALPVLP